MIEMVGEVQEIQGLYGAFTLSERVLQKIWFQGDFDQSELLTVSGKSIRILDSGRWNSLEGPDFKEACIELDGVEQVVDVEVHFSVEDWQRHKHDENPNFNEVGLHVVLYVPNGRAPAVVTRGGKQPELLCLMPRLERDLEACAVDDALLRLERVEETPWMLGFLEKTKDERRALLHTAASERWRQKVAFAQKRLSTSTWSELCHQYCLEVLGYARNRAPMSSIALKHSLASFAAPDWDVETLYVEQAGHWHLNGLRPANQPKRRLQQYAALCRADVAWPTQLRSIFEQLPAVEREDLSTAVFRKASRFPSLLEAISNAMNGQIGAKRLNTLICDAYLPLVEASGVLSAQAYWQHCPQGDAPDAVLRFLKTAQVCDRSEPLSNGLVQGALGLFIRGQVD